MDQLEWLLQSEMFANPDRVNPFTFQTGDETKGEEQTKLQLIAAELNEVRKQWQEIKKKIEQSGE